jgi:hypothetical protein
VVSSTSTTSTTDYTPYLQQACTYTIPSGTSGSVSFCIGMAQTCDNSTWGTCATGSGNDFLVDDIVIKQCPNGTTNACTYAGTIVTPVTLVNFMALKNDSRVDLDWQTATEENNDYFVVEKSRNAVDFITVDIVDGSGNSQSMMSYSITDYAPYRGISYYRLKQVDYDGKFSYSKIVAIKNEEAEVEIYPNPNQGSFKISVVNEKLYSIELTDMEGKLVYKSKGTSNTATEINGLSKGLYVVRVIGEHTITIRKIIVI